MDGVAVVSEPGGPPGRGVTIGDHVARRARAQPQAPAIAFCAGGDDVQRSYGELDDRTDRLAAGLRTRGITPGDRVAVLSHNRSEVLEVYLACARLGAVCVPVNFRLTALEIEHQLRDSGSRILVVEDHLAAVAARAASAVPEPPATIVVGAVTGQAGEPYESVFSDARPIVPWPDVPDDAPAFILYTSGTTGRPKGAVLTHRNLYTQVVNKSVHIGLPSDCRTWLVATPLFHVGGLAAAVTGFLVGGRVVVGRSGRFSAEETVSIMERERITTCFLVPAQWQAICDLPGVDDRDLSALRIVAWGGAPASTTLLRRMIELFPHADVSTAFGQTETTATATVLHGPDALRRIGSVGRPMLGVEVRIVDENMDDVPSGEVGEIVYRGSSVMQGYWNRPRETAEAFAGGWFHSGDLVRADPDGYLYVVDRAKDMIISGGENVYCLEVEDVLAAHPGVAEAALVGVPDERWGEIPVAIVVAADPDDPPGSGQLTGWCRERLASFKCPRRVSVVDRLPRNPGGKVLKHELRRTASASTKGSR